MAQPIEHSRRGSKGSDAVTFSYMFQNNALFDSMTAAENVALRHCWRHQT